MAEPSWIDNLAQVVIRGLEAGRPVELDHIGVFYPDARNGYRFEPAAAPKLFIAYVREDIAAAERLYDALEAAGFSPWMDVRKLLPGQNWPRAIENAIDNSDLFVPCFSEWSVRKRGGFQAEIRYALDCAKKVPLDQIFVTPVRLDECRVPRSIARNWQYIDLFPNWAEGISRLITTIRAARAGDAILKT